MDAATAVDAATALLAIAALGGLTMVVMRLRGAVKPPDALAMAHGFAAAAALTLLAFAALTVGLPPRAGFAFGLLIIAAIGGAFLNLRYHMHGIALPLPIIGMHAALAVIGFGLLLSVAVQ